MPDFSAEGATRAERNRELGARARDVQMLKFGQLIDLERLEATGVNKPAEELREKIIPTSTANTHSLESHANSEGQTTGCMSSAASELAKLPVIGNAITPVKRCVILCVCGSTSTFGLWR